MLSVFAKEFIAVDEFYFSGQECFCPSLIYYAEDGAPASIKAFHELFDVCPLFVQPVQLGGLGGADDTRGLFEDGLFGMGLFVAEENVSDSFMRPAGFSCNMFYYLMSRHCGLSDKGEGTVYELFLLSLCQSREAFCPFNEVFICL